MWIVHAVSCASWIVCASVFGSCVVADNTESPTSRDDQVRASPRRAPDVEPALARSRLEARLRAGESLGEVVSWPLPYSGRTLAVGVAADNRGARRFEVDDLGQDVVFEDALRTESAAREAATGRMSHALFMRQRDLPADAVIGFVVLVRADFGPSSPPYDGTDVAVPIESFNAHVTAHRLANRQRLADIKRSLVEWLGCRSRIA